MKIELSKFIEIENTSHPFYIFVSEYFAFSAMNEFFIKIENYNITKNNIIEFQIDFIKFLNISAFWGNWLKNLIVKYLLHNTIIHFQLKIGSKNIIHIGQ